MLKVAITGNMGSGKSTVCSVFSTLGIPVFNADNAAAYEMANNQIIIDQIKNLFGATIYKDGIPDRGRIASLVFNDTNKMAALNAIMHPATIHHFQEWCSHQQASYIIKEAAILFESGTDSGVDKIITVSAPEDLRLQRVTKRNPTWSTDEIKRRFSIQMDEQQKIKLSDFVIINDDKHSVIEQVLHIHKSLTE
ncbi:MAG: dephospho-CoA kinase [Bacteroidota bacterium]